MQSHFVDWKKPFLSGVVELILEQNALGAVKDNLLDLSGFIFVFPSGLAIRSFEEKLARGAEKLIEEGKLRADWFPPEDVIPVGEFSERLYEPEEPFAEKPALLLAWKTALCENPDSAKAVFPNLPAAGDFAGMLEVAALLARLHEEVAQEGLDFSSPREYVEKNVSKEEVFRWNALCEIQQMYYKTLAAWGLCDKQKERLNAIRDNRIRTDKTIVLVGAADLNSLQKKILGKVGDRAVAFVQAPEKEKCLFDEYGCVKSEAWEDYEIGIPHDTSIVAAPDTAKEGEYAACYTHLWGAEGTEFRRSQVAVSLCDPAPRPYLSEKLAELGIEPHFGEGKPFATSRVALLLRGAADYLRTLSYDGFAAWIRHPDVEAALGGNCQKQGNSRNTLADYDRYQNRYIPQKIMFSDRLPDAVQNAFRRLLGVHENRAVSQADPDRKAPLSVHLARIDEFLQYFYPEKLQQGGEADPSVSPESAQIDEGLRILYEAFDLIKSDSSCDNCGLTAAEAIDFVLRCASGQIREETSDDAADITGWLDARFAETPHLVLVGLNEGIVPESRTSDLFLPDTVRTDVGIENNRRRYARDAYYLTAIVRRLTDGGKDGLRILFARAEDDGTPTPPSRLLFAENEEKIAQRVRRFFGGRDGNESGTGGQTSPEEEELAAYFAAPSNEAPGSAAPASDRESPFALPVIPLSGDPPAGMRVTDFSSFLASPYKYFLKEIYGLKVLSDSIPEIQTDEFGTITHRILKNFGESACKDSADEGEIRAFLSGELDRVAEEYKKESAAGTALLQLELIRRRLEGFARWQARWRGLGNEIVAVECPFEFAGEGDYSDPKGLHLKGTIDRIDYNRKLKQWFVFDYKTFDKAAKRGVVDSEDLKIRLAPFFPGNEESFEEGADSGGAPETDGFPAVDIKVNNMANQEHRDKKQKIFPPELVRDENHWKDLQLPLYTLLAEEIIKSHNSEFPRGKNPLIPGYILLKKDNSCEASLAGWSKEEIDGAILTARWVRQTIVRIWKEGKADPNALLDPKREELGHLYEPDDSDGNKRKSWDVLRDFPD